MECKAEISVIIGHVKRAQETRGTSRQWPPFPAVSLEKVLILRNKYFPLRLTCGHPAVHRRPESESVTSLKGIYIEK